MSSRPVAAGSSQAPESFDAFYTEVKEIEKRDSVLTSEQQINRLLRPGSTYFNLNPFEVLQVEPETTVDLIKKKYRSLSILVHPDKNQNRKEEAQSAFEIVNRAWKTLEHDVTRKKCLEVYEEAKDRTDIMIADKKKKLRKDGKGDEKIPEDDPAEYKHRIYVMVMKLFADMERKKQQRETRDMEERKRKRESEIDEEERRKNDKEWQKNFEESRQNRVDSWLNFQAGSSKKKAKKQKKSAAADFNPPKLKPESR